MVMRNRCVNRFSFGASALPRVAASVSAGLSVRPLSRRVGFKWLELRASTGFVLLLTLFFSTGGLAANAGDPQSAASDQYKKAVTLFQQRKFTEALAQYQKVLTEFPGELELCAKSQIAIARTYYELKDVKKAHYAFRTVTTRYSSLPAIAVWAQIYLADMYQKEALYSAAVAAYKELVSKYSDQTDLCITALTNLARTQRTRGKIAEALAALQRIVDEYPVSSRVVSDAAFARADICHENQYYDAAVAELGRLMDKYPRDRHIQVSARLQMARYLKTTDAKTAKEIARDLSSSEIIRGSPDLLHSLLDFQCRELGVAGWRETAARYLEAMSKCDDRGRAEFAPLEVAYYFEMDMPRAAILAAEFLKKYPTHGLAPEAACLRAGCLQSSGDAKGALAAYDALVAAYGKLPEARTWTNGALQQSAKILEDSGRIDEAINRLEQVSAATPAEIASKLDRIGEVFMRAERWEEAAGIFQKEAKTRWIPNDALCRATYNLGYCCDRLGDKEAARTYMQNVIDQGPNSSWAGKARGMFYLWNTLDKSAESENPAPP